MKSSLEAPGSALLAAFEAANQQLEALDGPRPALVADGGYNLPVGSATRD